MVLGEWRRAALIRKMGTDSLNSSLKKLGKRFFVKERPFRGASERRHEGALARVVLTAVRSQSSNPSLSLVILSEAKDPTADRSLSAIARNSLRSLVYSPSPASLLLT